AVRRVPVQSAVRRLLWDQFTLPRVAANERADLVLALLSFGSATRRHRQISVLRHPIHCRYYMLGLTPRQRLEVRLRRYFLYLTVRASDLVVAPTAAVRDMVREAHPDVPLERFRILPHAFEREISFESEDLP